MIFPDGYNPDVSTIGPTETGGHALCTHVQKTDRVLSCSHNLRRMIIITN